jgi:hypothetical protein
MWSDNRSVTDLLWKVNRSEESGSRKSPGVGRVGRVGERLRGHAATITTDYSTMTDARPSTEDRSPIDL